MSRAIEVSPTKASRLFGEWVAKLHCDKHVRKLFPSGYSPLVKARLAKLLNEKFSTVSPSEFHKLTAMQLLPYLEEIANGPPTKTNNSPCKHSPDFRSVCWHGADFSFTRNQAVCVKELWTAWEAGTPELDGVTVVTAADVAQARLIDVFKAKGGMHPAWGNLIVPGATKGAYRLTDGPTIAKKGRKKVSRKTPRKTPR